MCNANKLDYAIRQRPRGHTEGTQHALASVSRPAHSVAAAAGDAVTTFAYTTTAIVDTCMRVDFIEMRKCAHAVRVDGGRTYVLK
jgi:hypothetical protein